MKRFFVRLLAVISVSALAGLTGLMTMAQNMDDLTGSAWRLLSFGDAGAPDAVIDGTTITLEFREDGRAGGSGGCNTYTGGYSLEGDAISFTPMASTRRACPVAGVMQQEMAYFAALEAASSYEIQGELLIITYGDGQQLTFAREGGLINSSWQLVSYGDPVDPTPVIPSTRVTAFFGSDGSVGGDGGCNVYGGGYALDADAISITQVISTLRACLDNGSMEQERVFFDALQSASRYVIENDRLIITYAGGQQLTFARYLPLINTRWQLAGFADANVQTAVIGDVTLEFLADGLAGSGGCNQYSGQYVLDGNAFSVGPVISTERACLDAGVMQQEMAYYEALNAASSIALMNDQLVITYGEGKQLIFVRASTGSDS